MTTKTITLSEDAASALWSMLYSVEGTLSQDVAKASKDLALAEKRNDIDASTRALLLQHAEAHVRIAKKALQNRRRLLNDLDRLFKDKRIKRIDWSDVAAYEAAPKA